MMTRVVLLLTLLAVIARPAWSAEPAATGALVDSMRQARYSDGFEARMSVSKVHADGRRLPLFKLALVGQFSAERERLAVRGISPDKVRNRFIAAERRADGGIRAIAYGEDIAGSIVESDPFAKLWDSELMVWAMFGPWWNWPKHSLGGSEQIGGRECVLVRSQSDAAAPICEVVSCVDREARLSLRTQLFDARRMLIRTIAVEQTARRDSGAMAARKLLITGPRNSAIEVEVYSGDENYVIPVSAFSALDDRAAVNRAAKP